MIEIQGGEGGKDSKLFVQDMLRMYLRYASSKSLKSEILEVEDGFAAFVVFGPGVSKYFSQECGKHVVQRVPPTERNGRAQTSVVTVAVLPISKFVKSNLKDSDIEIKTQNGSGPGGQHQNKTQSAVRMKHIPTGLSVFINGRSQHQNRARAFEILSCKVQEFLALNHSKEKSEIKQSQVGDGGRAGKIRTYNLIQSRCVDHRTGKKTSQVREILDGKLDLIL